MSRHRSLPSAAHEGVTPFVGGMPSRAEASNGLFGDPTASEPPSPRAVRWRPWSSGSSAGPAVGARPHGAESSNLAICDERVRKRATEGSA